MKFTSLSLAGIFLFLPMPGNAQAGNTDSLSVADAIRLTITGHPLVHQATALFEAAQAKTEASKSPRLPSADAEFSYTRLSPVAELAFPGMGDFKLFPENNYDEHIALRQTLYDFGKTNATIALNERKIEAAQDNIDLVRSNLAFYTVQTFYAILFLRQSSAVQEQQINALNEHLLIAQKKVQSGSATDYDILTTQVRIAAAQNKLYDLANELHKREAQFRRLLGLPPESEIRLRGSFTQTPVSLREDSLITLALSRRAEIKLAHDGELVAEADARVAEMHDRPALNAAVVYGVKNGYMPNLDAWRGNWVLGLEATIPLFNGFRTRNESEEAQANLRAAKAKSADAMRTVIAEVQQAISDLRTTIEKLQTSTIQVDQANRAVEMASVRYENGVITNLDLIDAQTALEQAKLTQVDALKEYVIGTYSLKKSTGEPFSPAFSR
jgi:outer membrane protein